MPHWLPTTPPLALRNVLQGRARSVAAIAGIGFALIMVLLQLGFLQSVKVTAAINYDQLDFDLALVSPRFEQFYDPGHFPRERLLLARSVPGVIAARPLWTTMSLWRCPPYPADDPPDEETAARVSALDRWWLGDRYPRALQRRELLLLGIDLDEIPFKNPIRSQVEQHLDSLRPPGRVLFNAWSNPDFGSSQLDTFDDWELNHRGVVVAGTFTLLRSFGADASVLCGETTFAQALGVRFLHDVNFGLVTVEPGRVEPAADQLRALMPPDVQIIRRQELYDHERHYWVTQTATGQLFTFGVAVAMLVAGIVIYQVLSNDIRKRLPEYATLKAMGHTDAYLSRVVLTQALIYALAAFVPAVLAAIGLYALTRELARIPMHLTP